MENQQHNFHSRYSRPHNVLEQVRFRLAEGIDSLDFLAANEPVQAWLRQQPGFLYRTLCQNPDSGEWIDLAYWADAETATATNSQFMQQDANREWVSMIDHGSMQMQHSEVLFAEAGTPA
ncbi:hypothetical protein [Oceanobacter mangrovi]|uniref:hypothetical protein n=1 Tax=Oceanobacter mangrovi TaxID=2862510 RepID=UPI001C8EBD70|nr:hypothetical protein [Oceanobacter mangrovi]